MFQNVRQTGGLRLVVSHAAIGDLEMHIFLFLLLLVHTIVFNKETVSKYMLWPVIINCFEKPHKLNLNKI
jgi:hypothetical protein